MQSNGSSKVNENNNIERNGSNVGLEYERYSDEITKCESTEFRISGVSQFQNKTNSHNERRSSLRRNVSKGNLLSSDHTESKVLVIYTGGTIGMMRNEKNGQLICFSTFMSQDCIFN